MGQNENENIGVSGARNPGDFGFQFFNRGKSILGRIGCFLIAGLLGILVGGKAMALNEAGAGGVGEASKPSSGEVGLAVVVYDDEGRGHTINGATVAKMEDMQWSDEDEISISYNMDECNEHVDQCIIAIRVTGKEDELLDRIPVPKEYICVDATCDSWKTFRVQIRDVDSNGTIAAEDVNARESSGHIGLEITEEGYNILNGLGEVEDQVTEEDIQETVDENNEYDENGIEVEEELVENNSVCFSNSGALGWLLCPIVTAISGVGESLWGVIENDFMQIPAGELFQGDSGVVQGWQIVQGIANTIFIILFLVVIFSQLTGVGIDNYGIKKILPKLIVVAILMNLSLILCQIIIDLSNILGSGLNNLFSGLAGSISNTGESTGALSGAGALGVDVMLGGGAVALFGVLTGGATLLGAAAAVGIAALGVVISTVVSILFMYLILIIRQAGVVLAIVVAPVAIVCYLLPNTEKIYKKWFDLFKALVIVYPICGAIIGAGQLGGAVLGSVDNAGLKVAAMLIQVIPFFLIPMILRSSLSLMGNVGARLTTWGRNLGNRGSSAARQGIQGTERFKNFSQFQQEQRALRSAQRIRNRLSGRVDLSARQQERLRKAEDTILAQRKRSNENAAREGGAYFEAMSNKQDLESASEARAVEQYNDATYRMARTTSLEDEARRQRSKDRTTLASARYRAEGLPQLQQRWERAFRDGDGEELDALTNVMTQRYGTSAASSIGQSLSRMNGIAGNQNYQSSLRTLQRTMNDNSNFAGNMKNKASDAFQMISDAGTTYDATTGQTEYQDLSYFSAHNSTSTDIKDWSTQSTATLQRAIESGALSQDKIREILNSEDPSVRSGIQSDDGKRDLLQAALYNQEHGTNLTVQDAASRYKAGNDRELFIRHEREAERRGKATITIPGGVAFEGYAEPAGFNTGQVTWSVVNGDYIVTDVGTGRKWNASTGTYTR